MRRPHHHRSPLRYVLTVLVPPLALLLRGYTLIGLGSAVLAVLVWWGIQTAPEVERPLWPELGTRRLDFWFYLGLCDARTRVFRWLTSFGLKDGGTGHTARVEEDRLVGYTRLLDALESRYQEWRARGTPEMRHWRLRFVPSTQSSLSLPAGTAGRGRHQPAESTGSAAPAWTLGGAYYHRTFTLPPPDRANATMAPNGGV